MLRFVPQGGGIIRLLGTFPGRQLQDAACPLCFLAGDVNTHFNTHSGHCHAQPSSEAKPIGPADFRFELPALCAE